MIIRKMRASFGCLENAELELHEGLNIITAPNGSGKSTWCAFIRCMLYGVDSAQREKAGVKPDKLKYAPWSGAPMAGEMEIEHEGRSITLSRSSKSAAAPFREFSALYSGTGQKVPGLSGKDAGETLTGMPAAVFESSVFVRQGGLGVRNGPELERRIDAIISSGEAEGVSYSDADSLLRAWQRKRKHNSSGAIPAAEARLAELRRKQEAARHSGELLDGLDADIVRAQRELDLARERGRSNAEEQGRRKLESLSRAREQADRAREALSKAEAQEQSLQNEIDKSVFQGKPPHEAEALLKPELEEYRRRGRLRVPRPLVFLLLLAGLAVCFGAASLEQSWLFIPGGLLLAGAVLCAFLWRYRDNHYVGWGKMLEGKYGFGDEDRLEELLQLYGSKWAELESAREQSLRARREQAAALEALDAAERSLVEPGQAQSPDEEARQELELLRRRRAEMQGRLEAMGDPMVTKSEIRQLDLQLEKLQSQHRAIGTAISVLREANDIMQQRFSPRLGQRAGELMQQLSGGEYCGLSFDRSLSAEAKRPGDTLSHSDAFLSQGSRDQLYLALRLAICQLALPEDRSCPLILDEALVSFDDRRMGYALELLREIAKQRQVILFSCHGREARWLEENPHN